MSVRQYMKDKIPAFLLNLLGLTVLALFLVAAGISVQASALIVLIWAAVIFCYLTVSAFRHRNRLKKLMTMAEELEEKYLLPEIMAVPEKADERAFYQILKISEKSMLEKIDEVQRERKEYREYIEQWIL